MAQVSVSWGLSGGEVCDLRQISQGCSELHVELRLGTLQVQLGFTSSPASSGSKGLSGYSDFGSAKSSWFHLVHCFIISDLSLPCLPVAMFFLSMSLNVIHRI